MDTTIPTVRTDFTTMNRSDGAPPNMCNVRTLTASLLIIIISLCGLVGNTVVLWFLCFCLRRNTFSVYLVNLAVADFLFLSCQVLFSLEELIDIFHSVFIAIPYFFSTVFCFFYIASLSILSIISTERCLSILFPVWFRCHRPRHTSATMCALLWVLSLLLSTLEGNYCGFLFEDFEYNWCQTFDFITTAWLIFLFLVLFGSSLVLLYRIFYSFQRLQLTRLYVTIVLTVLVFLVCGLPFGIHWFLLIWIHKNVVICYLDWVDFLCSVNSSVNPIIYFFVGSFRQRGQLRQRRRLPLTLRSVLQRALQDTPELNESAGSFTQEMSRSSVM